MTQKTQTLDANIIIQREYRARIDAGQPLPAFHVSPEGDSIGAQDAQGRWFVVAGRLILEPGAWMINPAQMKVNGQNIAETIAWVPVPFDPDWIQPEAITGKLYA